MFTVLEFRERERGSSTWISKSKLWFFACVYVFWNGRSFFWILPAYQILLSPLSPSPTLFVLPESPPISLRPSSLSASSSSTGDVETEPARGGGAYLHSSPEQSYETSFDGCTWWLSVSSSRINFPQFSSVYYPLIVCWNWGEHRSFDNIISYRQTFDIFY